MTWGQFELDVTGWNVEDDVDPVGEDPLKGTRVPPKKDRAKRFLVRFIRLFRIPNVQQTAAGP